MLLPMKVDAPETKDAHKIELTAVIEVKVNLLIMRSFGPLELLR